MKLITFPLMIVFSIVVLVFCMPNLEQSRREYRSAQTFMQAQKIKFKPTLNTER